MVPTWVSHAALIAAAAGPVSHHLIWIRSEWDAVFYKIAAAAVVLQPLALLLLRFGGLGLIQSLIALSVIQTSYLVSLFASIAIYRLFFHSTRKFPGPFWARLWQWWRVYELAKSEKAYLLVHELHQKYGGVVRIGQVFLSAMCRCTTSADLLQAHDMSLSTMSRQSCPYTVQIQYASNHLSMKRGSTRVCKPFEMLTSTISAALFGTRASMEKVKDQSNSWRSSGADSFQHVKISYHA